MLVLSRKPNQSIRISENITIKVVKVRGNTVQLGIEAPRDVNIMRKELLEKRSTNDSGPATPNGPDSLQAATGSDSGNQLRESEKMLELSDDEDSPKPLRPSDPRAEVAGQPTLFTTA